MATRQIEFITKTSLNGAMFQPGDRVTVEDADAEDCCERGWAKDLTGGFATGELDISGKKLDVQPMKHVATTTEAGG
jgi:hypothetical protein